MKNLLYLYIIFVFCTCNSQKTQQLEAEYLESFSFILEEQQNLLSRESSKMHEKYLEMGNPQKAEVLSLFRNQLEKEVQNKNINLDSIFIVGKQIDIQENTHFFNNKDSLLAFFEIHQNPTSKQLLLSKLRLLRFGNDVIKKINQKHIFRFPYKTNNEDFWKTNPDFELLTTLNKTTFSHGDTLEMTMILIPVQKTAISKDLTIYLNDKKIDVDTFSMIATCENEKSCTKELFVKTPSLIGSEDSLIDKQKYIVNPAK